MLDFYRRAWYILGLLFATFLAASIQLLIYLDQTQHPNSYILPIAIALASFAFVTFILTMICLLKDYRESRRKDKEAKAPSVYEKRGPTIL